MIRILCFIFGHAWHKPFPQSSAWRRPVHRRPKRSCKRCGTPEPGIHNKLTK